MFELIEECDGSLWMNWRAQENMGSFQDWGHGPSRKPTDDWLLRLVNRCGYEPRGAIQHHSRGSCSIPIRPA